MSEAADLSDLTAPLEEDEPATVPIAEQPTQVLTQSTIGGLKIHPVMEQASYINILIYGDSGVGKTLLAGSADAVAEMSPVLLLDVEGGSFSLRQFFPGVDVVRVQSWGDIQKLYNDLYKGNHGYKTVVLDSLTEINKFGMYNIMADLVLKESERDPDIPSVREWGKNIEQTRKLVRAFRDLPMNAIFTALAVTEKNARTGMLQVRPSLPGKLGGEVAGFLDIVLYYYIKFAKDQFVRLALSQKTENEVAKDRSSKLPMVLESPTMQSIHQTIFGQGQGNGE